MGCVFGTKIFLNAENMVIDDDVEEEGDDNDAVAERPKVKVFPWV